MKLTIKILKGKPTRQDFHRIIDMLCEGCTTGIDQPKGITWDIEADTTAYNHLQKLINYDEHFGEVS